MKHLVAGMLLWWRPKLFIALTLGAIGAIADQTAGTLELLTPREIFARALLLIVAIEAVWWLGRNAYEAYQDPEDEVLVELGATMIEALVLYAGYLSVLAGTTILAGMLADTRVATFAEGLNLAFWSGVALIQVTRIVIHWKGSGDAARRFFGRVGSAYQSAKQGAVDPEGAFDSVQNENA